MTLESSHARFRYAVPGRTGTEGLARAFDEHAERIFAFAARLTDSDGAAAAVTRDAFAQFAAQDPHDEGVPPPHSAAGPRLAAAAYHAAVVRLRRRTQPIGAQAHHLPHDFTDAVNAHVRRCRRCRAWGPIPYASAAVVQAGDALDAGTRAAIWRDVAASLPPAAAARPQSLRSADDDRVAASATRPAQDDGATRDDRVLLLAIGVVAAFVVAVGLLAGLFAAGLVGAGDGDRSRAGGADERAAPGAARAPDESGGGSMKLLAGVRRDPPGGAAQPSGDLPPDSPSAVPEGDDGAGDGPGAPATAVTPGDATGDRSATTTGDPAGAGGADAGPSPDAGAASPAPSEPSATPEPPAVTPPPRSPTPPLASEPPAASPTPQDGGPGAVPTQPAEDPAPGGAATGDPAPPPNAAAPAGDEACNVELTIAGITVRVAVEC